MPVPEPHQLRASDAEREHVARDLRDAAAAGRLDPDELEERLERAYRAPMRADLAALVRDLPGASGPPPAAPGPRERSPRRATSRDGAPWLPALAPLVAVAVLLIAVWALTGAGYFWPVWPLGALAISAVKGGRCGVPFAGRPVRR
jgi:hypothetical protein